MFNERWLPLRAAADDAGAAPEDGAEGAVETPPSGPGSGRSELRQQLEKNFEQDRKRDVDATTKETAPKKGKTPKRVAGGAEVDAPAAPAAGTEAVETPVEGDGTQPAPQAAVAAPEGLSAEAKAAWAQTPPAVQTAVAKRLADSAKGVEELKSKYSEIDKALAPHLEAIRQRGVSPAKSIEQLFGWFQALAGNPQVAFPALAKSFGLDLAQLVGAPQQQQQSQGNGQEPAAPALDPAVKKLLDDQINTLQQTFSQKLSEVSSAVQRQSEEKTNEVLSMWAKDKPYFQQVRQMMANLIASGAVPLKDGQVDLDGAYDRAIFADPEVRTQVLAAQKAESDKAAAAKAAAEAKAQQDQAAKARKAAVSVTGTAPGSQAAPGTKPAKRKSVRETLDAAIQELSE